MTKALGSSTATNAFSWGTSVVVRAHINTECALPVYIPIPGMDVTPRRISLRIRSATEAARSVMTNTRNC